MRIDLSFIFGLMDYFIINEQFLVCHIYRMLLMLLLVGSLYAKLTVIWTFMTIGFLKI